MIKTYDWIMSDGYWIMPNKILFDNRLSDKEKLLYCLISSLCAEKWFCWASNDYLAEKIWYSKKNIHRLLQNIFNAWYITIKINKEFGNQRQVFLNSLKYTEDTILKNEDTPILKNEDNNNINNNINNTLISGNSNNVIRDDNNSLKQKNVDGKQYHAPLDKIKNSDDIRELLDEDEISKYNIQLKILLKMINLWYKVNKTKTDLINEFEWLKNKAKLYGLIKWDGNIAWNTFYQKIDKWYDWHTEKNKPVKNFKTSIIPFISK